MCYSKSNLKFGHEMIEPIENMSWRRRWSDISCVSPRHQHDEEWRNEVQVQYEHLEEIIRLKLAILMMIIDIWRRAQIRGSPIVWGSNLQVFNKQVHWYVKTCPKKSLSRRSMGEKFASLHEASVIKKEFHLDVDKIVVIKPKLNMRKAKVWSW